MINKKDNKLLSLLFPTPEIREFFCNDLFVEINNQTSTSLCISTYNKINKIRSTNLKMVKLIIENILKNNIEYMDKIKRLFFYNDIENLLDEIIAAYVFYISLTNKKFEGVDVFNDKKSICYNFFN